MTALERRLERRKPADEPPTRALLVLITDKKFTVHYVHFRSGYNQFI